MKIYCIDEFKTEFTRLKKKKSYETLESDIIEYFFDKNVTDLQSGTRLNNSIDTPYIKKRIKGSGGFRTYFLLIIKEKALYLMFVHPKAGSLGADNITDQSKALLYKKVLECIKSNKLYKLTLNTESNSIDFSIGYSLVFAPVLSQFF